MFARTKHRANRIAEHLAKVGVSADAIHGNKSQTARQRALERFRAGRLRVLVATDIAARGLDVEGISHVINLDLPHEPEGYVHRIGRTARAGAIGSALSFCDISETSQLRGIEKLTGISLKLVEDHPFHVELSVDVPPRQLSHDRSIRSAGSGHSGGNFRGGKLRRRRRPGRKGTPALQGA